MSSMTERLKQALAERFSPEALKVVDDSAKHAGHAGAREGGESHFTVTVVSEKFEGMNRVARHRAVNDVCKPFFDEGLHALAIHTKTPIENREE